MAKALRWKIPFQSVKGINYEIRIYDEGYTGSVVTLQAGETPITTQEDNDEDIFTSLRTSTGTISVIDTNGTLMEQLLPANNIDRPVRLVSAPNTDNETIEWQGFLSCEAYNQDYTAVAQELQLNINSLLEAMDSVEVEQDDNFAFATILTHITKSLASMESEIGMSLLRNIIIDATYYDILNEKYIYNNSYFKSEENVSGDNIRVDAHSISIKEILSQLAKPFNMVVREVGNDIYIMSKKTVGNYYTIAYSNLYSALIQHSGTISKTTAAKSAINMANLVYRGTGHQSTLSQGKKRVVVEAALKDFSCKMSMEKCPKNNLVENPSARQSLTAEIHANTNETFYNLAEHKHYLTKAIFPTDLSTPSSTLQGTSNYIYQKSIFWTNNYFRTYYKELVIDRSKGSNAGINYYISSFMAWWKNDDDELKSCLVICGLPTGLVTSVDSVVQYLPWSKYALTDSNYLFKQRTPLAFAASDGYLLLNINTLAWFDADGRKRRPFSGITPNTQITVALQFGTMWLTTDGSGNYTWSNSFATIRVPLTSDGNTVSNWTDEMGVNQADGLFIPIPSFMVGFVSIYVYHQVHAVHAGDYSVNSSAFFDVLISKLDVSYVALAHELRNDRSENRYAQDLENGFKDEESIKVELASDANNKKMASLIWNDSSTPCKLLTIEGAEIRPEEHLLSKMAAYYGSSRRTNELEVEHPTAAALPLLTINGYDGKKYLPLAEERDWQQDTSKLTCMETPDGDS